MFASGGMAAVLVATVFGFWWPGLPDPATADRDGLLRWLVSKDLDQEPYETRQTLARRLEKEFGGEIDWAGVGAASTNEQRQRLWNNVLVLLEPWFADKVDGYFQLPEAKRPAFVDQTLQRIEDWKGATVLSPGGPAVPAGEQQPGLMELVVRRIGQWTESATPERREQVREFMLAIQVRWLRRALLGPATG